MKSAVESVGPFTWECVLAPRVSRPLLLFFRERHSIRGLEFDV